ncbi:MAG: 3-oxo-tetronate 4-phosphate decarboxylase [Fimbriimonadaceae bacterium]|nr:3-oxo-tetronate 4-phosphate decarboxylase [Fimbriimonadaceae bacterium]
MREAELRQQMVEIGRRLCDGGLVGATEGNISCRLENGTILCTPTGLSKGRMRPEDLAIISLSGEVLSRSRPSTEIRLHLKCMQVRPDCHAVIHAHPTLATGLSVAGKSIPTGLLPEADIVLGPVINIPFARPGTDAVPEAIQPFLPNHKTFLLSHHGAFTLGVSLEDAFHRMETLERVAAIYLAALQFGGPTALPPTEREWLASYAHGDLNGNGDPTRDVE